MMLDSSAPEAPEAIWIPEAFSQLRSVSMQIPSFLAASVGCCPCSVTSRTVPALNAELSGYLTNFLSLTFHKETRYPCNFKG